MENSFMMGENSRLLEKSGRAQEGRPTRVSELTLRQVLPWPASGAQTAWRSPGGDSRLQPATDGVDRTARRPLHVEIVVDPSQLRLLVELLRRILAILSETTTPSRTGQNGALPAGHAFDLTPREKEILEQMIEGKSNRQIALELEIATATVKCHVSNILSKMGAESRTEAVAKALRSRAKDKEFYPTPEIRGDSPRRHDK